MTADSSLLVSEVVQFSMSVDRALAGWARAFTHRKPWRDAVLYRVGVLLGVLERIGGVDLGLELERLNGISP